MVQEYLSYLVKSFFSYLGISRNPVFALELCSTVGQLQQSYREYLRIKILSSLQSRVSLFQLLFFESDYLIVTPRIGVTIVFFRTTTEAVDD